MKNNITICSVVHNDKQSGLFDVMVKSIIKYVEGSLKFIICDSGGNNLKNYLSLPNFKIVDNQVSKFTGSAQHGDGLNKIFPLVKTEYCLIVDSDVAITDKLPNIPTGFNMLAAEKGKGLYHVCFLLFKTAILYRNGIIDFRPGTDKNRGNRPYKPSEDVGWRLLEKVKPEEIELLRFVDCKTGQGQIFDSRFQSDEFLYKGKTICVHFGRGSNISGKNIRKGFPDHQTQLAHWKNIVNGIWKG